MRIRAATADDAAGIARVHVETWRTTYRGILPDDFLAALSSERREQGWRRELAGPYQSGYGAFVAEDAGEIVGFATGGPERTGDPIHTGELYAIYVFKASQGKGIGRQLTHRVCDGLLQAGIATMLVWVLAANAGARAFYEAMGGLWLRERPVEIGGGDYPEVAYGWLDVRSLVSRLSST